MRIFTRAIFINFFSILNLALLFIGTSLYITLLKPYPGMDFFPAILGAPILLIAYGISVIIFLKKEKNLFNKISSLITLSVISFIMIISVSLSFIRLFVR